MAAVAWRRDACSATFTDSHRYRIYVYAASTFVPGCEAIKLEYNPFSQKSHLSRHGGVVRWNRPARYGPAPPCGIALGNEKLLSFAIKLRSAAHATYDTNRALERVPCGAIAEQSVPVTDLPPVRWTSQNAACGARFGSVCEGGLVASSHGT